MWQIKGPAEIRRQSFLDPIKHNWSQGGSRHTCAVFKKKPLDYVSTNIKWFVLLGILAGINKQQTSPSLCRCFAGRKESQQQNCLNSFEGLMIVGFWRVLLIYTTVELGFGFWGVWGSGFRRTVWNTTVAYAKRVCSASYRNAALIREAIAIPVLCVRNSLAWLRIHCTLNHLLRVRNTFLKWCARLPHDKFAKLIFGSWLNVMMWVLEGLVRVCNSSTVCENELAGISHSLMQLPVIIWVLWFRV